MLTIAHNLTAMNAQRQYGISTKSASKLTEKLSSGYRINRAADDAAGLAISEKMRKQIRGLTQGVENTKDGVALCQVADGALAEVHSMLQRITELSVKAANGTNTDEDRQMIQEEITQILKEVDRIGDTTTFNEQPIFKGSDVVIKDTDGSNTSFGDLQFSDFKLVGVDLGKVPLIENESADFMHLQAIVDKDSSVLNGTTFNLIYGSGSTSDSSLRITDNNNNQIIVDMDQLTPSNFTTNGTDTWSRDFVYSSANGVGITIKQTISLDERLTHEKNYVISYEFSNTSNVRNVEFMFHVDSAYNNNDTCEGYFIGGNKVNNFCIYNNNSTGSTLTNNSVSSSYIINGEDTFPDSFSIIDIENALAFSEKISFNVNGTTQKPDSISIGNYSQICDWDYYNSLNVNLGQSTDHRDLGFCLYYNLDNLSTNNKVTFNYGIVSTEADINLKDMPIQPDYKEIIEHLEMNSFWIQSGAEAGDGMYVTIDEMNSSVLGIKDIDVSTLSGATHALGIIGQALQNVSSNRAQIGAQQNRLEHTIANEENIIENTTAAESQIRDTDMAKAMVEFSNLQILLQAGESILAQANQSKQGVLSLLQ